MPERAAGEPAPVGLGLVLVAHDRGRDVPALPAGQHRAVLRGRCPRRRGGTLVEAAELVEHRPAQEQEAAEHPVGLDRLVRARLVEMEVVALVHELAQRRPPDDRPVTVGKRRRDGCGAAVRIDHARPGDAAARVLGHEVARARRRPRLGHGVGVRRRARRRRSCGRSPRLRFAAKPSGRGLCERLDARRHRARDVRDHEQLVDLRPQRRQRLLELGARSRARRRSRRPSCREHLAGRRRPSGARSPPR